jgi:hypothetical protein
VMGKQSLNRDGGGCIPTSAGTNRFGFSNHRNVSLRMGDGEQPKGKSCWVNFWAKDE